MSLKLALLFAVLGTGVWFVVAVVLIREHLRTKHLGARHLDANTGPARPQDRAKETSSNSTEATDAPTRRPTVGEG